MHLLLLALLSVAPVDAGPPPDPLAQPRALFAHRLDRTSLDAAIAQLDGFSTPEALLLDARARRFRAMFFELRRRPLDKAAGLADLSEARSRALQAWGVKSDGIAAALKDAKPDAVPALVELASADLRLAGWHRPLEGVAFLREALHVSARAVSLDPDLDGGAPRRLHASALAALPASAGGDLRASRFEFERAISAAPAVLDNRVEMAARYAVKAQNRHLFHALLVAALHLDVDARPERRPEQLLARARALALLHRERELFRR